MTSFAERSYTWPKWLPKMKALLTLILQCVHIKTNVFTLFQEEYLLYTMSLWLCYRNFKAFVQRYSWIDDIESKLELIYMPKKVRIKVLASSSWLTSTDTSLTSSQVIFFSNGFDTFSFFMRAFIKKAENDSLLPLVRDLSYLSGIK